MDEDVITINYWKEIRNEISDILKDLKGIILLTHNSMEFTDIVDILNKTRPDHFLSVLYISLIRSYEFMKLALDKKPLDNKRIFFIDCVSGFAFPPEENIDDCLYHKPPLNLEEMKEIIGYGIEKSNSDIIVLDSLTQFINFSRPTEHEITDLYKFLRTLKASSNIIQDTFILLYDSRMNMMQNLPKMYIDMMLYDSRMSMVQNLPKMYIDMILKVEVLKEISWWKD